MTTIGLIRRLGGASALCLLGGPAFAHAHLTSAVPPVNGAVAAAPSELDLTFSEGIALKFTGLAVKAPDGTAIATGPGRLGPGRDTVLVVPVTAALPPGTYTVSWHALATDGHKTNGTYTFKVGP